MAYRRMTPPKIDRAAFGRALPGVARRWRWAQPELIGESAYTAVATLLAVGVLVGLPGTAPSDEASFVPIGLALFVGFLLTVRLAPGQPSAALVVLPAMVVDARFGLAGLSALGLAALAISLVRGVRGPRVVSAASHNVLAYAVAHLCAQVALGLPAALVFAVVFALARVAWWHVAARLDASPPQPGAEKPDVLLSLPLSPIGLLPLVAGAYLGDGALLLVLAALLTLLFIVREAANLATARAEVEQERDKLAGANTLQDELVNLITHELRNPLTLVMSYAQMARRAAAEHHYDAIPGYLGHVERAGRTIDRLMENLLQLSKLERSDELPTAEAVGAPAIIEQVVADLVPLANQKHQTLTFEPPGELEPVLAIPLLLHEALSNLISNAVKYTPEGGEIGIWAEGGAAPHTVVLGVRDTGIGLSEEDQRRLFTRFFRSSDPRVQRERGSGLGLALTHALVTRIGGTISVASVPGHGTTFRLTLPTAPVR